MPDAASLSRRHRFPAALSAHWGWLSHRRTRGVRESAVLPAPRGAVLPGESLRRCRTFGQTAANGSRRRRPHPGDIRRCADQSYPTASYHRLHRVMLPAPVVTRRDAAASGRS